MVATRTATTDAGSKPEVLGTAVTAAVEGPAALAEPFRERVLAILGEYGLPDPTLDDWYDAERFQGVLTHIVEMAGPATVERIGREVATSIDLPDVTDTAAALAGLDSAYRQLHRGTAGTYEVDHIGERSARVQVSTPYPDAFDRGLLLGVGYDYSEGVPRVVPVDADGTDTTVYEVTW